MPNFKEQKGRIWEEGQQPKSKWFDGWFSEWSGISERVLNGWKTEIESDTEKSDQWRGAGTGMPIDGSPFKAVNLPGSIEVLPEIIRGQFGGVLVKGYDTQETVPYFILHKAREQFPEIYEQCRLEGLPFAFYFLAVVKIFIVRECIDECILPHPVEVSEYTIPLG